MPSGSDRTPNGNLPPPPPVTCLLLAPPAPQMATPQIDALANAIGNRHGASAGAQPIVCKHGTLAAADVGMSVHQASAHATASLHTFMSNLWAGSPQDSPQAVRQPSKGVKTDTDTDAPTARASITAAQGAAATSGNLSIADYKSRAEIAEQEAAASKVVIHTLQRELAHFL
jgi:fructose/tagatose bisphosphate aldolase